MLGFGLDLWKIALMGGSSGAMALLSGEPQGMALDFTTAAGPQAGFGQAAVLDQGTPANNLSNAPADSFLTQSGTSPKLVLWSDGLYRWSPHNLIVQSETLGTTWTATGVTVTGNHTITEDTNTSQHRIISGTLSITSGFTYTYSADLTNVDRRYVQLSGNSTPFGVTAYANFDLQSGVLGDVGAGTTASITALGSGVYRCQITITATADSTQGFSISLIDAANAVRIESYLGSGKSIVANRVQLNRGATPAAYHVTTSAAWFGVPIEYDPVGGRYYGLVEPAATNIALQSQAFGTTWLVDTVATVSSNVITAPDGTLTADKLVEAVGTTLHYIYQNVTFSSGAPYTWSVYAKAGERSWFIIDANDGVADKLTYFDLTNGVIGTNAVGSNATITSVGNGWYRCTVTRTTGSTAGYVQLQIGSADNVQNYAGDITKGLYLWQAQFETGSVATSTIPTFAATVTRSADNINVATSAFPSVAAVGSFIAVVNTSLPTAGPRLTQLTDGTNNERNLTGLNSSLQSTQAVVHGGSVQATQHSTNTMTASVTFKVASAWQAGDMAQVLNGGTPATGAPAAMATGITTLYLGRDFDAAPLAPLRFSTFVALPRRPINAELQARTAP